MPVRSIMSRRPAVVTPEDDVRQAARLMSSQQVRRLPVVDKDRVVGVVSLGDLAKCGRYEMEISRALTDISENIRQPWNRGRGGKQQSLPQAPVSLRLLHQGTDLTGLVPGLPGVLPEQLLEAGVRGGLRAGEIGGHGGLLLGKPPAESP